jgi:hypothetical protein
MKYHTFLVFMGVTMVLLSACKKSIDQRITALEKKVASKEIGSKELLELAGLYKAAAEKQPNTAQACIRYTQAAETLWKKGKTPAEAARELISALQITDPAADKVRAAGLLAETYKALREKPGLETPDSEFTTQIKTLLLSQRQLLDAALQQSRDSMVDNQQKLVNNWAVEELTDRVESYALMLGDQDELKRAELLFEAANANRAIGNFARAIGFYTEVAQNKSDIQKAANSQFMIAFVFENDMDQLEQARTAYQLFLKNFPNSEMADDAKIALANLGKTPEELLETLTKKSGK